MAQRVAEDEMTDFQPLGARGQPGGRDHGLVHGLVERHRWGEVVHDRHAGKAAHFGDLGAFDERIERQAHLRQIEMELEGHAPLCQSQGGRRRAVEWRPWRLDGGRSSDTGSQRGHRTAATARRSRSPGEGPLLTTLVPVAEAQSPDVQVP